MRKVDELRNVIANQFACEYKAYDFGKICNAFIDGKRFVKGVFSTKTPLFLFAQHGQTLTGVSPEHAQIVGSV